MRLYNTSYDDVYAKCNGNVFFIKAQNSITVSPETGAWLKDKYSVYGVVDISPESDDLDPESYKGFVAKRIMEGVRTKLAHLHEVVDQFLALDQEVKSVNNNGTVLGSKAVKNVMAQIKTYTELLKKLEDKFGFSIAAEEFKAKEEQLFDAIDAAVAAYEADSESKQRTNTLNREADRIVDEFLGEINAIN